MIADALQADGVEGDARGIASAMVGSMTLARAVDDPALSDALLASGRRMIFAGLTQSTPKNGSASARRSTKD